MSVKDLIAQLDAAKIKAEEEEKQRRERELEEYHKAVAIAEEAARLEAIAEAKRKEEEAAAERAKWRVDEEACAEEVRQMKAKFLEANKKPKKIKDVQIKDIPTIVLDIGSNTIKAGYAGRDAPEFVISTVVGTVRSDYIMDLEKHADIKDIYFGDEVWGHKDVLKIERVVERGKVVHWGHFQQLLEHVFCQEMKIPLEKLEEMPIIVTEPPLNPKANRAEMAAVLFEYFKFPAVYVGNTSSFALYATGRITGVVVDIGYGVSSSVAIYEGTVIPQSLKRLDVGGIDLDSYFVRLLNECGHRFNEQSVFDQFVVRDMKERHCYCAADYEVELKRLGGSSVKSSWAKGGNATTTIYDVTAHGNNYLPGFADRKVKDQISLGAERFKCAEALFHPGALVGRDHMLGGVHGMVKETIKNVPIDLTREMYSNVTVSGGTTLLPGFTDRLKTELRTVAPDSVMVDIHAPVNRHLSVWIGASILGSAHHFNPHWISLEEYNMFGSEIVLSAPQ